MTDESWSGVDVQLKRRRDLVPNLVSTVQAYAAHERQTLRRRDPGKRRRRGRRQPRAGRARRKRADRGASPDCSASPRRTRTSRPAQTSSICRTSSRTLRTTSRQPAASTTATRATTTTRFSRSRTCSWQVRSGSRRVNTSRRQRANVVRDGRLLMTLAAVRAIRSQPRARRPRRSTSAG